MAGAAHSAGITVAVAESLTAGWLARELAAAPDASKWFAGGVVAYRAESKFRVLSVTEGPLMSRRCAEEMARGVRALFAADVSVAMSGVGGPDDEGGPTPLEPSSSLSQPRTRSTVSVSSWKAASSRSSTAPLKPDWRCS